MRKMPITLATLTVVSALGAAMTLPANAKTVISVSDINYTFEEMPYDFTRIDYEAGTIKLRFNGDDDKGLAFRKIVFADFNFEKYDTSVLNQRVAELREEKDPEWALNVIREGEAAEAGIYEQEYQIDQVIKGHKLPIGKFFYAIEYADNRSGTEEIKWIDGALDFAFCTWSWIAEGEFQVTPCTLERQAPNNVWWKMTRENEIEGDSLPWNQRLAKYIRDRLSEVEAEVTDKTKPLTRARWDELSEYVNDFYAPANSSVKFFDKDLPLYRGQVAALLYEHQPKEETGDNEGGEGGNEGGNNGDNKGDGDGAGGNKGDSENTPSSPDDSKDPNKPDDSNNPEKPENPTPGDSQPSTLKPRPETPGSSNNSGSGSMQKPSLDKDNNQKDDLLDKKPVLTPDTSKKPVSIIQNANKTDNATAGKLVATTVKRVAQAQVGQNTAKTTSEEKDEDEKNDQQSVSDNNKQEEKNVTVPALNVAEEGAAEEEKGGFNWWFVMPIVAVLGVLAAWWTKRALGDNRYKSMK